MSMHKNLKYIEEQASNNNKELKSLNQQLAELLKQCETLNRLVYTGVLDTVTCASQNDILNKKISEVKKKKKLLADENADSLLDTTTDLIKKLDNYPTKLIEFDAQIFKDIVEKVLMQGDEVIFVITNKLQLKERNRVI